jgi:hypothetical protein
MIPEAAVAHYKQMQGLQGLVVMAASDLWSEVGLADLTGSWARNIPAMVSIMTGTQSKAATAGASYGAATLANQGLYEAPQHFVDPSAFAGVASDGRSLAGLLYSPVPHTKSLIAAGMDPQQALESGGKMLTTIARTQVADAGRGAAGVDTATRKRTGFIRMLNPPSCARCSVLAGRFYRWNSGFDRHPRCDCVHVQTSVEAARTEGLMHDPYEYFHSLSPEAQDKAYTKAGAQAIRDGGDIFQVVNSRRGMKPGGLLTTEGTSRRGNFGRNGPRLTPEAIYGKGLSREATLKELERYGYILPGGQNPLGVIRGQAEGSGQLGRGGTRVGAREAVLRARETGVRDPNVRATMTAAELRAFDAQSRWESLQKGVNPFNPKKPLTPEISARIERDYRAELAKAAQPRVAREAIKVQAKPLPTAALSGQALADTVTYHSTLHMSDGDLADMMSKHADDPAVFDKIMEVMDERDAKYMTVNTTATGAAIKSVTDKPPAPVKLDLSPTTNPAARKARNLTQVERASEEYQNYAMSQYNRALDDLNGVLLNAKGKAHARGAGGSDLEMNIFTGSAVTGRKYASEELLRWWEEQGRETLGSFRYKMYGWGTDRKAAQTVRNMGYERGQAFRDRSQF